MVSLSRSCNFDFIWTESRISWSQCGIPMGFCTDCTYHHWSRFKAIWEWCSKFLNQLLKSKLYLMFSSNAGEFFKLLSIHFLYWNSLFQSAIDDSLPTSSILEFSSSTLRIGLSGEASPQAEIPLVGHREYRKHNLGHRNNLE